MNVQAWDLYNLKISEEHTNNHFLGLWSIKKFWDFKDRLLPTIDEDFNSANGITAVFEMAKMDALAAMMQVLKICNYVRVFGIFFVEEVLDAGVKPWFKPNSGTC